MSDILLDRIKAHRSAPDVYDAPTFDDMADRIEELEAKLSKSEALLAKAVEAERVYCANVVKHFHDNGFPPSQN